MGSHDDDRVELTPEALDAADRASIMDASGKLGGATGNVHLTDLTLPAEVARAMVYILESLVAGHAVHVSVDRSRARDADELTTSQAAQLLGMSRPTLIGLLDRGEMRYRMVGTHRRIPRAAVLEYKRQAERGGAVAPVPSREERMRGLREMAELTNDLGLGY